MHIQELNATLTHWGQAHVIRPLTGGYRNQVWLVDLGGKRHVAKTTRRSEAALRWLGPVYDAAETVGFVVPRFIPSKGEALVVNALTVETFIEGTPVIIADLSDLAERIAQFHKNTRLLAQRPTFASSTQLLDQDAGGDVDFTSMPASLVDACRDAWRIFSSEPQSVIHGDPNPSNMLITPDGKIALIDWDEARVDASIFDQLALAEEGILVEGQRRALQAWEIAACWHVEQDYAQGLAERFYDWYSGKRLLRKHKYKSSKDTHELFQSFLRCG